MKWLKEFRNQQGLTLYQMSQKLGISKSLYEKIEYGERNPSSNFIKKFISVYPNTDTNIFFNK